MLLLVPVFVGRSASAGRLADIAGGENICYNRSEIHQVFQHEYGILALMSVIFCAVSIIRKLAPIVY